MAEGTFGAVHSIGAKQNTQREYESVIILRPETAKPEIAELIARMQKVFVDRGGRLLKIDSWGIRVLAYPVEHYRKGIYLYWRYLGGSDMVAEFERHMRLVDRVIRFYTVLVDQDVDPNARPSEVTEELLDAAAEPGPDPDVLARKAAEEAAARRSAGEEVDEYDDDDDDDRRRRSRDGDDTDFPEELDGANTVVEDD
jgi:small subunit ribosomal protein S6